MSKRICIIGLGLMGGSLACASASRDLHIHAVDLDASSLEKAKQAGHIQSYATTMDEQIQHAALIILAVPMGAMAQTMQRLYPFLSDDTIITDVGSSKQRVMEEAKKYLKQHAARFVPGHPLAGSEKSGFDAAIPGLFANRKIVLTPHAQTDANATATVTDFWQTLNAQVITEDAKKHDEILAVTSHLPHMITYGYMPLIAEDPQRFKNLSANGFRDFTRIAASDPTMWADICIANRDNLLTSLKAFQTNLEELTKALEEKDHGTLMEAIRKAKSLCTSS